MGKYKLITCDLDGTLLGSDLRVSDENNRAIKEFHKKDIPFVPCTGRTLGEMREIADNPDIRYIIYSSGAAILDKETGECIDFSFPSEVKEVLLDILSLYETYRFLHADGNCYIDADLKGKEGVYKLNDTLCDIVNNVAIPLDDFKRNISEMTVECISVFFKNDEELKKCREELLLDGRFMVAEPWERNLEIFHIKAGKDNAIKALAKKLEIDLNEVISIGDSDNDANALRIAGLGIAVSNGSEEIKKIATEIACSNDENVAEYVLKKFF